LTDRSLLAAALGSPVTEAFLHEQTVYLIGPDGRVEAARGADPALSGAGA